LIILVVDDNSDFREIVRLSLQEAGHEVLEAGSSRQALQLARQNQPDLILLDILMPGLDGYETCRQFKTHPSLTQIPIMVLTALGDPLARYKAHQAGADDYVAKPISPQDLRDRVERLLRRYELFHRARRQPDDDTLEPPTP